jgi:hypothetical protein
MSLLPILALKLLKIRITTCYTILFRLYRSWSLFYGQSTIEQMQCISSDNEEAIILKQFMKTIQPVSNNTKYPSCDFVNVPSCPTHRRWQR